MAFEVVASAEFNALLDERAGSPAQALFCDLELAQEGLALAERATGPGDTNALCAGRLVLFLGALGICNVALSIPEYRQAV